MFKRLLLICVLGGMVLTACDSDEVTNESGLEGAQNSTKTMIPVTQSVSATVSSPLDNIETAVDQVMQLPNTSVLKGHLVFVQGNTDNPSQRLGAGGRIFMAGFDGESPVQLAERVSEPSVILSPDQNYLGYMAVDGYSWYMYLLDLETMQFTPIYRLPNRFGTFQDWSPDSRWLLIRSNQDMMIISTDGQVEHDLGSSLVFWLEDGHALVLQIDDVFEWDEQSVNDVYLFDPQSGDREPIDIGLDRVATAQLPMAQIRSIVKQHDTDLVANIHGAAGVFGGPVVLTANDIQLRIVSPRTNANLNPCDRWTIEKLPLEPGAEPEMLYSVDDTLSLSDYYFMSDGTLLFQRWYLEGCDSEVESLRGEVIALTPDGEASVVAKGLYAGISTGFLRGSTGKKYALSPEGRYLATITGSFSTLHSGITITDLETGTAVEVMSWTADDANRFLIWESINAVFWTN